MVMLQLGEGLIFVSHCLRAKECKHILVENSKKANSSNEVEVFDNQQLSDKLFERLKNPIRQFIGINESTLNSKYIPIGIYPRWALIKDNIGWAFSKNSKRSTHEDIEDSNGFVRIFIQLDSSPSYGPLDMGKFERGDALITMEPNRYPLEECNQNNIFISGFVKFERNQEYEKNLFVVEKESMSYESESSTEENSIILNISGKEFEIPIIQIRKFPQSLLNILIDSPMNEGVTMNGKSQRVFPFPQQNPSIFERFIMPILLEYSYLDIPVKLGCAQQLEISNEFKFWGFLSPYDKESLSKDNQYSNKTFPFMSSEISLISNALHSHLEEEKRKIEVKLSIMKARESIGHKLLHNFEYPYNELLQSHSHQERSAISKQVCENLKNKYECIPLEKLYDDNFFLIGSDRELYETSCSLFGFESVSLVHLNFIVDHQSSDTQAYSSNFSAKTEYDNLDSHMDGLIWMQMNNFKTVQELEDHFTHCGIAISSDFVKSRAKEEHFWKGSGVANDEYFPDYSLFKLSAILIDVQCKQKSDKL